MPRVSDRIRYRLDDGRFRVTVFARKDHASFRIEAGFRGERPAARNTVDERTAIEAADAWWASYQAGAIDAPVARPTTLEGLRDALCDRPELAPATRRSYRSVWGLLVAQVGGHRPADKVYPSDLRRFFDRVEGETHDSYLRTLRAGFRFALKKKWIGVDPTEEFEFAGAHVLGPWLPYSEWPAYLAACPEAHEIRSGFVLETGLRAGELAAARWPWIHGDIGRRALKITHDEAIGWVPKHGTERAVPLTDRAEYWLERAAAKWGTTGFIFSASGLAATTNFPRETRAACAAARITSSDFHGLRRSAGAHWLECGVTLFEVSRLLGHRDITTTQRWYAALADSALVAAIAHVEQARGPAPERSAVVALGGSAKGSAKPVQRLGRR